MTILTKLSNLLTSAIELPSALHACVEMAREADCSRHEMDRLPSELNEELEQKQNNLDLWRSWALNMVGMDDNGVPSWQLRDEIKRKLADDDGAQICGKLAARIAELERELERWHSWAQLRFHVTSKNCDDLRRLIEFEENNMLSHEREASEEKKKNWGFQIERLTNEANELARAIEAERRQLSMANKEVEILRCELNREREARKQYACSGNWLREWQDWAFGIVELGHQSSDREMRDWFEFQVEQLRREREARRWRKQSEEPAPKKELVLELTSNGNGHPNLCLGMYVARGSEWRHLSPEDMPDNQ